MFNAQKQRAADSQQNAAPPRPQVPSGILLMLRSLGIDISPVQGIIEDLPGNIQVVKAEAIKFAAHFDARLQALEKIQSENHVLLCKILSCLKDKIKHDITELDASDRTAAAAAHWPDDIDAALVKQVSLCSGAMHTYLFSGESCKVCGFQKE